MNTYSIFDSNTGDLFRVVDASETRQAQQQCEGPWHVVFDGDWRGHRLGDDGWPEQAPEPVVVVSEAEVKAWAARLLAYSDWYVTRSQEPEGKPIPARVIAYRRAVRDASTQIEHMRPIPVDYRDAKHWPDQLED